MISEHLRTSASSVRMRSCSVCLMAVREMTDVCGTIGDMTRGYLYAITAYVLWGFFPIYWKQLHDVPAGEVIMHRIIWSLVFLVGLGLLRRRWAWLKQLYLEPRRTLTLGVAAVLLAINWLVYVWGVNHGYVVQASLGYFITPLISVRLGVALLGEKLRRLQWLAVGLAAAGVLYLMLGVGEIPWVAFALAASFGLYGFSKKKMHLEAIEGLTAEMSILFLPALALFLLLVGRANRSSPAVPQLWSCSSAAVQSQPSLCFSSVLPPASFPSRPWACCNTSLLCCNSSSASSSIGNPFRWGVSSVFLSSGGPSLSSLSITSGPSVVCGRRAGRRRSTT